MNLFELESAIEAVIQDSSYSEELTSRINDAVLKVASGDQLPGRHELSPPLPDLYTTGTVDTVVGAGLASLPDDYNRDLFQVLDSSSNNIPIEPSFKKFLKKYPEINTGSVFGCAANGNSLLYRDVPAESEALTVHYYKTPDTLVDSDDIPTCIPTHLHRKLIVNQVCKDIFDEIEDGIEDPKTNTMHHESLYQKGLLELDVWVGVEKEPDYIDDQTEYCR